MDTQTPTKATLIIEYPGKDVKAELQPEAAEKLMTAMRNQSNGKPFVSMKHALKSEAHVEK